MSDDDLKSAAEATTRHGKLVSREPLVENEIVFLLCRCTTGEASGQNRVIIATQAMRRYLVERTPVRPRNW